MKVKPLSGVLVATDFSAGAQLALERALRLPLTAKAKVTLAHVIPDDIPGKLQRQAREEAGGRLARQIAQLEPTLAQVGLSTSRVTGEVLEGRTIKQLSKAAKSLEAELVVLGRHGRRPVADLFVGSTAQRVVREVDVPVLLVQTPPQAKWTAAMVALDLESKSTELLTSTAVLAPEARLTAFHASSVPFEEYVTLTGELTMSYRDEFRDDAQKALAALLEKSGVKAELQVRMGDARLLILEEAKALGAQLLVLGTREKSKLKRRVLGSVAEWVLGHATTDVLVVPQ